MDLNEKQMEIVEQYDMAIKGSFRSRGCLHVRTETGLFMVLPYYGSPLRLACELELQKKLKEQDFTQMDIIIPNREQGFITYDKYRNPFVVKKAYEGRECNLKEEEDIYQAGWNLAKLHKAFEKLKDYRVERRETPLIPDLLKARKQELKRIRNFIKKSGRKMEFELTFTSCYKEFYEEAEYALLQAEKMPADFWKAGYGICHGTYHQHNILMTGEGVVTLNLGQFHYNQQMLDLYSFMRKALEKNHFQKNIFNAAVRGYEEERKLSQEDYKLLKILFLFPEKFWKISNQYFNSKKCWMPHKNLEKLKHTIEQNEERKLFLQQWEFMT